MQRSSVNRDIESGLASASQPVRLEGYPSFASWITEDRDAAIYRRYEKLSARNLLYQQNELLHLEEQLHKLDLEDTKDVNNGEAQRAARFWKHYSDGGNASARRHVELQQKIRLKLKEYRQFVLFANRPVKHRMLTSRDTDESLLLESQVLSLSSPSSRTLRAFRKCFKLRQNELWGKDQTLYDDEKDLVALAPVDTDRLNIFLKKYFGRLLKVGPIVKSHHLG